MSVADEDEPPLKRATLEAHKRLLEQVSMLHPLSAAGLATSIAATKAAAPREESK